MGVIYFLLLSSLGLAITTQAQNCSIPRGENMNLKGDDIHLQTFADGTKVTFACDIGYVSAGGSPTITCTAGSWSPVRLICERSNCGPAGEMVNGKIDYPEGTEFGDKLVVTCNTGYRLVGNSQIICGAQGWLGRLPECEVVTCTPPPVVAHGTFSPQKEIYDYAEVVQYVCQNDYTLNGSKSISCSASGKFDPAPSCIMVECTDYNLKDGDWVEGSRPPHRYLSTVTYKCRSGFIMIGERTLTCGLDSQWSPGLPTCQRVVPPSTTTASTTRPSTKKPTVGPGSTVPPGNDGNSKSLWLGIGLTVLIGSLLTVCGCYFCGVPACIKEKRRSRRNFPDNVAPKDGEEVALS